MSIQRTELDQKFISYESYDNIKYDSIDRMTKSGNDESADVPAPLAEKKNNDIFIEFIK